MQKLYTIGHSVHSVERFVDMLNKYDINCLIDVRSTPYSRFAPQYNISEIKKVLQNNQKQYIFMGEEFGARRSDTALYDSSGVLDFNKVIKSSLFQSGFKRVKTGLDKGFNIAFMCTEKDPIDCHRSILVGRAFDDEKFDVSNIHEDGSAETQEELIERLLNHYFPNRNQANIFDFLEGEKKREDLVHEAYILRNKDIAYKLEEKEAGII